MDPLLENAPFPLAIESRQGTVLWSNDQAKQAWGELKALASLASAEALSVHNPCIDDVGKVYTVVSQDLNYQGEDASLLWLLPQETPIEQERDSLTGLLSFNAFLHRLEHNWPDSKTTPFVLGLVTIDISGFSLLNEVLGASECDGLLRQIAVRFSKCLDDGCSLCRVNGDQFLICTRGATQVHDLHPHSIQARSEALIHRIVNDLEQPYQALDRPIMLKAAIGVSTSTLADNPSDLIASSQRAMLESRSNSHPDWVTFNRDMLRIQEQQKALALELTQALQEDRLALAYQPFVDLKTGKLLGLEGLLRWNHPVYGLLSPDRFLFVAQASHLMFPLGRWVVEHVIQTAATYPNLAFSLNLSTQQLVDPLFLETVQAKLQQMKVKPESIVIEILESSTSTTLDSAKEILKALSEARVGLALDDADWDTKALLMLSSLSLRYVKIDRQIIANLDRDSHSTFCRAILSLASSLGRKSLAVGVESLEQCRFLQKYGCDWGQGNFFASPGPATSIDQWLAKPFLI